MNWNDLCKLAQNMDTDYELGIWVELNDFLSEDDDTANHLVKYTDGYYHAEVNMHTFESANAKRLFFRLLQFIEYYHFTIYIREKDVDWIQYEVLSSTQTKKAFLLRVRFQ
ncbi:hypothetical protein ACE3MZ_23420 [Paenibacillus sp. WLX1005]|uniref:hypothetical protein n=1 Tax=Paenibacillus sp. WLX1005 TaxID=3243766 RepID=UPI003983E7A5